MDYVFAAFMIACLGGIYATFPTIEQFRNWDENAVVTRAMIRDILVFAGCCLVWIVYAGYLLSRAIGTLFTQLVYSNRSSRTGDIDWSEWKNLPKKPRE
jgi:hypothetical protein